VNSRFRDATGSTIINVAKMAESLP